MGDLGEERRRGERWFGDFLLLLGGGRDWLVLYPGARVFDPMLFVLVGFCGWVWMYLWVFFPFTSFEHGAAFGGIRFERYVLSDTIAILFLRCRGHSIEKSRPSCVRRDIFSWSLRECRCAG